MSSSSQNINAHLPDGFNWQLYLNKNPDLIQECLTNENQAKTHYLNHGFYQNRHYTDIPDNFNWIKYKQRFYETGSVDGFMMNKEDTIKHFMKYNHHLKDEFNDMVYDKEKLSVVYFISINNSKNWRKCVRGQLLDLLESKIKDACNFYIVITSMQLNENDINDCKNMVEGLLNQYSVDSANYNLICKNENTFEYPGIKLVYDLACAKPDNHYILYLHTKGLGYDAGNTGRNILNKQLTRNTVRNWDDVIHLFDSYENINKCGLCPSHDGLIWFNFFYIRASYAVQCGEPITVEEFCRLCDERGETNKIGARYEYEAWSRTANKNKPVGWTDCYSLIHNALYGYGPDKASIAVGRLSVGTEYEA